MYRCLGLINLRENFKIKVCNGLSLYIMGRSPGSFMEPFLLLCFSGTIYVYSGSEQLK